MSIIHILLILPCHDNHYLIAHAVYLHCGPFDNFYHFKALMQNLIEIWKPYLHSLIKIPTPHAILMSYSDIHIPKLMMHITNMVLSKSKFPSYVSVHKKGEISTKPKGLSRGETMPLLLRFRMKWNNSKGRPKSYTLLILFKFQ